jgi:predicted RNA methylase
MTPANATLPPIRSDLLVTDELEVLSTLVPLAGRKIIELGCGAARLARDLLARHPDSQVTGLEVDRIQHDKNLAAAPVAGLQFLSAGPRPSRCRTSASIWR